MDRKRRAEDEERPIPNRLIRQLKIERETSYGSSLNQRSMKGVTNVRQTFEGLRRVQVEPVSSTILANGKTDASLTSQLSFANSTTTTVLDQMMDTKSSTVASQRQNEALLPGFALLRAAQLLNFDIYYLGLGCKSAEAARLSRLGDLEAASKLQQINLSDGDNSTSNDNNIGNQSLAATGTYCRTFLDELAEYNPLQRYIDRYRVLDTFCAFLKICLSLIAIMIGIDRAISNIILCLFTHIDESKANAANSSMALFVLILHNLSLIYILFATVFNGHLLWNLFSQRLFLISRRFQYKTMLNLLVFVYLEYIINISFINNLYEWDFTSNNIQSRSYSVLANLRIFLTQQDEDDYWLDMLLTVVQFARGIIRVSPYIVICYALICLKEHINAIRNQNLLTDSLKRRQRLQLVVNGTKMNRPKSGRKKRVIFATTEPITNGSSTGQFNSSTASQPLRSIENNYVNHVAKMVNETESRHIQQGQRKRVVKLNDSQQLQQQHNTKSFYLSMIGSFDELESYITNLYIFTDRLNRFLGRQALVVFFIVHNLVITVSLIVPDAIRGGTVMVYFIRFLVIVIAIVPFVLGQSLSNQLESLSKQIDRIIIQQQFIHRRRDNLVRIRELIHDIRVNCGAMLTFNVETGIKYLVIAMATAFFIEQEHYKLTRRH